MSGHSKWSSIKHKKGAADAKRGALFTKLTRAITVAAREGGGDIEGNPSLALAVQKAKDNSMPKDNIERAINKGTGADQDADAFERIVYEGYGPGGVALLVDALTDNRNRTGSEVRHTFSKFNGNLGEPGSVNYLFERKGELVVDASLYSEDDLMAAIDAGAEDVAQDGDVFEVVTDHTDLTAVREALEEAGVQVQSSEIRMRPTTAHARRGGRRGHADEADRRARGERRRPGRARQLRRGRRRAGARGLGGLGGLAAVGGRARWPRVLRAHGRGANSGTERAATLIPSGTAEKRVPDVTHAFSSAASPVSVPSLGPGTAAAALGGRAPARSHRRASRPSCAASAARRSDPAPTRRTGRTLHPGAFARGRAPSYPSPGHWPPSCRAAPAVAAGGRGAPRLVRTEPMLERRLTIAAGQQARSSAPQACRVHRPTRAFRSA